MSLFQGSLNLKRLNITSNCPSTNSEVWINGLKTECFKNIELKEDDVNIGFAPCAMELYPQFTSTNAVYGKFIVASLRIDSLKCPTAKAKMMLNSRIELRCQNEERDFLSKDEIKEMKEEIMEELASQTKPETKIIELAIDTQDRVIFTTASSEKDMTHLRTMLKSAFDVDTEIMTPTSLCQHIDPITFNDVIESLPLQFGGFDESCDDEDIDNDSKEGSSFLTWLFHLIHHRQEEEHLFDEVGIIVDEEMVVKGSHPNLKEATFKRGNLPQCAELTSAFSGGKNISKMKLLLASGQEQWSFSIENSKLGINGLKLPQSTNDGDSRHHNRLLRLLAISDLYIILDRLFSMYLNERYNQSGWSNIFKSMRNDLTIRHRPKNAQIVA
jgi:hypothetical protein